MRPILAIHWIVTTYGTWLHGDPRGSWKQGQLVGPDPFLEQTIRQRMQHDAVVLNKAERILVAAAFADTCRGQSQRVYGATIQSTHVHIVFAPLHEAIKTTIARLKRRSAVKVLALRRNMPTPVARHLWTAGRFCIFINDTDHLHHTIEYVRRHNRSQGLPDDPYDWIDPPP